MPSANSDLYSIDFFEIQLRFAARVASVLNMTLIEAVGNYTNIYVRLGMGTKLDSNNPDWQSYIATLEKTIDKARWTYETHCRRVNLPTGPLIAARVGCFSYALLGTDSVRLQFHPEQRSVTSPLAEVNRHLRRSELTALFRSLKDSSGFSTRVIGASWLYNLASYRSLFPKAYIKKLQTVPHPFQRMPLWGQFLTRNRGVRKEAAHRFQECTEQAGSIAALAACFPLSVMSSIAPASCFYEDLGL